LVYCGRYVSDDEAFFTLSKGLESASVTEPRMFKYKTGRREKVWNKNCIAIGLSAGFLEPVESTSIHLAMSGILRLLKMFPADRIEPVIVDEFNRQSREEMERVRNFVILHYCATERADSAFWRYCKGMEIPVELENRIKLFCETGIVPLTEKELFRIDSWTQVMFGQRLMPKSYHPIVNMMGDKNLSNFLKSIKENVNSRVAAMPSHQEFIDRYCKAGSAI
jgi:tryptophan 7-halogenase